MNFLEERIAKDGVVKSGNVLKVDSFLNHQMDIELLDEIGREFRRRFSGRPITKVLTIESSGIGIAYPVAREFGVPLVFAKKSKSINIDGDMHVAEVASFTHGNVNQVIVAKKFLSCYNLETCCQATACTIVACAEHVDIANCARANKQAIGVVFA